MKLEEKNLLKINHILQKKLTFFLPKILAKKTILLKLYLGQKSDISKFKINNSSSLRKNKT